MNKLVLTSAVVAAKLILFPSCSSLPSVANARAAVVKAREHQAAVCALPAASRLPEECRQASYYLGMAEQALKAAQAAQSELAPDGGMR